MGCPGSRCRFETAGPCVRIEVEEYKRLKAYFLDPACHRSAEALAVEFAGLRFQAYEPFCVQFFSICRAVNRARQAAGYERVPLERVPWRWRLVRPFGEAPNFRPAQACV